MNSSEEFGKSLKSLFANKDETYLSQLEEFFSRSANVYSDVLLLLNQFSINDIKPKTSLPYIILQQLDNYVKKSENGSQLMVNCLTLSVRLNAIDLALRMKNKTWIAIISDVFDFKAIRKDNIIEIINQCLNDKKFFEASILVIEFELMDYFDVKQILVPLLLQDKMTVVDDYIRGNERIHGFKFIQFLDKCFADRNYGQKFVEQIPNSRRDKLQPKAIQKLVNRLLKQHNIDESACPNIIAEQDCGRLGYLVREYYKKETFSEESFAEIMTNEIGSNKELQKKFLVMIVKFGQLNDAIKWANHYKISQNSRPFSIRYKKVESNPIQSYGRGGQQKVYYDLKMPFISDTHWINCDKKFESLINHLIEKKDVIGIDGEWPPTFDSKSPPSKLALLQIASSDSCHLIDALRLKDSKHWTTFTDKILNSQTIIKIGFGFKNDLSMIRKSVRIDTEFAPQKIFDLNEVFDFVLTEYKNLFEESAITETQRKGHLKGLSKCVFLLFGKPLDKREQLSDWNRRPLRDAQLKYAALDSFCLIEIFDELRKRFNKNNYDFEEFVDNFLNHKLERVEEVTEAPKEQAQPINVRSFLSVVDTKLQRLGRYLRICGADVLILESKEIDPASVAIKEGRVLFTCGLNYKKCRGLLPNNMCFGIIKKNSVVIQLEKSLKQFNVIVTEEDLFSRCPKCNCNDFQVVDNIKLRELHKMETPSTKSNALINFEGFPIDSCDKNQEFLICCKCGQIYWEDCRENRWKDEIKSKLFRNGVENDE